MVMRKKKGQPKVIGGIVLTAVVLAGLFVGMWHHFDRPVHPADLVEFWEEMLEPVDVTMLNKDLTTVTLPQIDFTEKPLEECLNVVLDKLNQDRKFDHEIRYRFLVSEKELEQKINIKLTNTSAAETIRWVTELAMVRFLPDKNGEILIFPRHYRSWERMTAKFSVPPGYFTHQGSGPFDVKNELVSAGRELDGMVSADYYPGKGVVVVLGEVDRMFYVYEALRPAYKPSVYEVIKLKIRKLFDPSFTPDPFAMP